MPLTRCSLLMVAALVLASNAVAQVCARVVIQIEQELTLEREGFEARLGISNGQPAALENFSVTLRFTDADGNSIRTSTDSAPDSGGKFYYRVQTGYAAFTSVAPGATTKLAFLIVPTLGAAGAAAEGSLYYVGATVKYTVNGEEQTVEVAPDFIRVRPMPLLQLQYFLPGDVYGDDPMTVGVKEPIVPFPLGVRVINHSAFATARTLKIQSGQPEIIDNAQGLLIDFRIVGCEVNGQPAAPSLLADFGDVSPQRAAVADWLMTATLSGRFVTFTAEITHASDLGGSLTSLIPADAISAHRLIGKVKVDLPGRDQIPDFLAVDNMAGDYATVKLYESENDEISEHVDYFTTASGATLTSEEGVSRLGIAAASTVLLVSLPSPIAQDKLVKAVRSDGKVLPRENCWISKRKNERLEWVYTVNLFDTNKGFDETYALSFSDVVADHPPLLTIWGGQVFSARPDRPLVVKVSAVDPDGLIPRLESGEIPDGASFVDGRNGTGMLSWLPTAAQIGSFFIRFVASDGTSTDAKTARVDVAASPVVGFTEWQKRFWPGVTDLSLIGVTADADRDGLNNLLEYALGGDPTQLDESVLPLLGVADDAGNRYLTLTFNRRTDDPALVYEVVASDLPSAPLDTWVVQTQILAVTPSEVSAEFERVQVRDSDPISSAQRYLRLRIHQPDSP